MACILESRPTLILDSILFLTFINIVNTKLSPGSSAFENTDHGHYNNSKKCLKLWKNKIIKWIKNVKKWKLIFCTPPTCSWLENKCDFLENRNNFHLSSLCHWLYRYCNGPSSLIAHQGRGQSTCTCCWLVNSGIEKL